MAITIHTIETPSLGDRSYLVHDGSTAFVIDPQRDIDRVQSLARTDEVTIEAIFETHIHNDYVTGGLALAKATGARYYVNADDEVSFERTPITDNEVIEVGSMKVRALHTPGHTFTHLSYALEGERPAVFTGGSVLFGSTGRPDLLGAEHARTLAHHQHDSAARLGKELPDETEVMPTHGFGSFCSATQTEGDESTIGHEKKVNPAFTKSAEDYVEEVLAGLDAYPAYYVHMGPSNAAGPTASDLTRPEPADRAELKARLDRGEWVVDLRTRKAFAAGHAPRTFNFGLDGAFSTYLGWMIPWGTPLTLLGETAEQVDEAQRELSRIGVDWIERHATGGPEDWTDGPLGSFETADFRDLEQVRRHRNISIIDVRLNSDWDAGHIEGATHIPLHELMDRMSDVPEGEVWVHCASGYRASVAASVLAAANHPVVLVDDNFGNAKEACLPVTD